MDRVARIERNERKMRGFINRLLPSVLILASLPAMADGETADTFMTGSKLYEFCQSDSQACIGYVVAVADVESLAPSYYKICAPKIMTARQAMLAFQGYAQRHPELLPSPAAELVLRGLYDTFPCGKVSN